MVFAAARSAAYWRLLGPSHPVKRHDVPSVHTLARRQPVMSLSALRIRREHLLRLCGRPLWAEPTEGFDRSIGWSGSAKALDDWRDQLSFCCTSVLDALSGAMAEAHSQFKARWATADGFRAAFLGASGPLGGRASAHPASGCHAATGAVRKKGRWGRSLGGLCTQPRGSAQPRRGLPCAA